jgi:flagellar protein FliS
MANTAAEYGAYRKVNVETASQGKLVVMLFNGAIQRAEEAKRQLSRGKTEGVHNNLLRAQDIIAELRGALNMKSGGDLARNLDRVYEYFQHLLIKANIRKEVAPLDEAVEHLTAMRDTWQQAFDKLTREEAPVATKAQINQHGAGIINVQG